MVSVLLSEESKVLSMAHKDLPAQSTHITSQAHHPLPSSSLTGLQLYQAPAVYFFEHFRQVWKLRAFALRVLLPVMLFPQISVPFVPLSSRLSTPGSPDPLSTISTLSQRFLSSFFYLDFFHALSTFGHTGYFLPIFSTRSSTVRAGISFLLPNVVFLSA